MNYIEIALDKCFESAELEKINLELREKVKIMSSQNLNILT